jgi:hypothetical protein
LKPTGRSRASRSRSGPACPPSAIAGRRSFEDAQDGNSKNGDRLTAYEEYRGLIVGGQHTRRATGSKMLDPRKKDLAVLNVIGAKAKPGLELFEKASGVRVLEMRAGELPASRLLNGNRTTASRGEQYGMKLVEGTLSPGVVGENRPVTLLGKTPKLSEEVVVDFAEMTASIGHRDPPGGRGCLLRLVVRRSCTP